MKIKAAVLYENQTTFNVEEVDLAEPQAGEILVKIAGTGICHADLDIASGAVAIPRPVVLGHEGAGVVAETGTEVTGLQAGDHVVLTGNAACGKCQYCVRGMPYLCEIFRPLLHKGTVANRQRRLSRNGEYINHSFMQSSFAEYAVVPQEAAVKIRRDTPLDIMGFLGCSGITGMGSVVNTARVRAGSSVAIFGCGSVGMNVLLASVLVGAASIIAVDLSDSKLAIAGETGATHTVNPARENSTKHIKQLTGGGADYTFAAVGSADAIAQAFDATRPGGICVVIGGSPETSQLTFNGGSLLQERTIRGCRYGSSVASRDIPAYIDLFMSGKLPLDRLVTGRFPLAEINAAFSAVAAGEGIKTVIIP